METYLVKLPAKSQSQRRGPKHRRKSGKPASLKSPAVSSVAQSDDVGNVDIGTGPHDLSVFDVPSIDPSPVLKLPPSASRNTRNNTRRKKNRTPQPRPLEQWDPGTNTSTAPKLQRERSQNSDSSVDSLSVCFLSSMGHIPPDVGLSRMTFQLSPPRRHFHLSAKTMLTRTRFNSRRPVSLLLSCRLRRSRHTARGLSIILRMHLRSLQGLSTSCRNPSLGIGPAHPHTTPTPFP